MRVFKIKKCGILYKVYEGLKNASGLIVEWKYIGDTLYNYQAYAYVRQNGREYDPSIDRVAKVWGGYGYYMYNK